MVREIREKRTAACDLEGKAAGQDKKKRDKKTGSAGKLNSTAFFQ
jgi:hypothetical protein